MLFRSKLKVRTGSSNVKFKDKSSNWEYMCFIHIEHIYSEDIIRYLNNA